MARSLLVPLTVAANLLLPVSILIFARGFFPYKPFIPGLAQYEPLQGFGDVPEAPFDRLIFMVVDALRRYVFLRSVAATSRTMSGLLGFRSRWMSLADGNFSDFVYSEKSGFHFTQEYALF